MYAARYRCCPSAHCPHTPDRANYLPNKYKIFICHYKVGMEMQHCMIIRNNYCLSTVSAAYTVFHYFVNSEYKHYSPRCTTFVRGSHSNIFKLFLPAVIWSTSNAWEMLRFVYYSSICLSIVSSATSFTSEVFGLCGCFVWSSHIYT
jgi:hypothetical protein